MLADLTCDAAVDDYSAKPRSTLAGKRLPTPALGYSTLLSEGTKRIILQLPKLPMTEEPQTGDQNSYSCGDRVPQMHGSCRGLDLVLAS